MAEHINFDVLRPDAFFELTSVSFGDYIGRYDEIWKVLPDIGSICDELLADEKDLLPEDIPVAVPLSLTTVIWKGNVYTSNFEILGGDPTKGTFQVIVDGEVTSDATVLYAGCVLWDRRLKIGKGVVVEPGALIKGPAVIGDGTEVRQGAYVRGKCLIGKNCVVGHTTEVKNSIMLDGAKAGHFAYIGDSILGKDVNLGAGVKLANLKINRKVVKIKILDVEIDTGMKKLGAIIGDGSEIGCNSVTNPGVLLGPNSMVWPGVTVPGGYYPPGCKLHSN
ncbi:hypothetical protein [Thermodesulforhabdus norvegica]|uniref:Transferase hexapeptide (Six repeat-containing protein) n=1 Tax=Thermodesulforhabdus norvegica TaxID=39841 RepID=A0A1I4TRH3_9BACT|nr:hypothetical protein [Thermodesulforhabdus norvegica]SFM79137.1 transferase hexapeptide (six repeat-containing protein) [Thermodesulforhabdus norvegica]